MTLADIVLPLSELKQQILELRLHVNQSALAAPAAALVAWLCYRLLQRVRVKSLVRGLPGPQNPSWLTGNFPEIYDVLNLRWHHEAIRRYGKLFQINGMFGDEQLYITDPRAMHQILVKEHAIFEEPQSLLVMNRALMGDGLLATLGDHHKKQRKVLNPVFSVKHMRDLLPIFWPITEKLIRVFESKLASLEGEGKNDAVKINVYEWAGRTSLEFIAQGGAGASLDPLIDGEDSEYSKLVKEMVPTISRLHVPMQLLPIVYPFFHLLPTKIRSLILQYSPISAARKLIQITDRLEATSRGLLEKRKTAVLAELAEGQSGGIDSTSVSHRLSRDVLSVLLRAEYFAPEAERLPESEVVSQITTLLFAAQDTTSSALARALQVLATHPEAQARLRQEVRHAKETVHSGESPYGSYDDIMRLPFLDAVMRETLRLFPPVSWIWRVARASTTLPLYNPVSLTKGRHDDEAINAIPVAKNQQVVIGIAASHRDESVWGKDANTWRPERWLADDRLGEKHAPEDDDEFKTDFRPVSALVDNEARYPGVYSGMMTFSGGARSCIGFKFALLALKLQLAALVDGFQFGLPDEEIVWNMNHIAAPTVRGREFEGAQMPLKVSIAA